MFDYKCLICYRKFENAFDYTNHMVECVKPILKPKRKVEGKTRKEISDRLYNDAMAKREEVDERPLPKED